MILSERELDGVLEQWRKEYGWGGMPTKGGSASHIIQRLIDHQGFLPNSRGYVPVPIKTQADEVDATISAMQTMRGETDRPNEYFRAAMVLRCEYLTPYDWPESERLASMGRIGMSMSRTTYYNAIKFGRAFLAGALGNLSPRKVLRTDVTPAT